MFGKQIVMTSNGAFPFMITFESFFSFRLGLLSCMIFVCLLSA